MLGGLTVAGVLAAAGPACAAGLERLGLAGSSASHAPSCPGAPCQVITATTGFQASLTGRHNAMVVKRPGRVTSWSIELAALTPGQVSFFDGVAHGPARAGLVILHQGAAYRFRVTDAGPLVALAPYFGRTMTFELTRPLPVEPGDVVALAVPTWAPALAVSLDPSTAWRASRLHGACTDLFRPTAQTARGALTKYQCVYRTASLTYGATVADDPARATPPPTPRRPEGAPKKSRG
ncbi:MAG: hypothetical protein QOF77_1266 [Solirubrobacteraceae bacterium]|nr:hypothetical protein [Solirubrobacteraceae bacterium]